MNNVLWSKEEEDFLRKHVMDGIHPKDFRDELNTKFGKNRTAHGIRGKCAQLGLSTAHLSPKSKAGLPEKQTVKSYTEEELREELSKRGYQVEKRETISMDKRFSIGTAMFKGERKRFAVISCTQLGSKYQQLTFLHKFYDKVQEEGIKIVFHCGDMVDGINVYRGHTYELFLHGAEAQEDYAVEYYPKRHGIKTYVIEGNHDHSFQKTAGVKIIKNIAQRRKDIIYMGDYGAFPQLLGLNLYVQHGGGGVSYARSYKLQKMIEQMAPASKPDLYFVGHYHVSAALFQYRNVTAFMIPCFQSQTPHLRRLGLYPEIGGLIVEVTENDAFRKKGIAGMKFEWVPFYVPIEKDYQ